MGRALVVLLFLAAGCGSRAALLPVVDSSARQDGRGARDIVRLTNDGRFQDAGGCVQGKSAVIGRLCVGESFTSSPVTLLPDKPIPFQVYPKGCFSSSATKVHKAFCSATASGTSLHLVAAFCIEDTGCSQGCTADCNGGGRAECTLASGVPAGTYVAELEGLTLNFAVPSTLTFGGLCKGEQF